MYEKTTHGILVRVSPEFLSEESDIAREIYFWAYHITIENRGEQSLRLQRRRWRIVDEHGFSRIVEGEGVVGECPLLGPGERFEYSSSVSLPTPSGEMSGSYSMISEDEDSKTLSIDIPLFLLESPHAPRTVH